MRVGIYTVDARWRTERVIVEVDGGDGHASYARMQRDRERDLALRRAGYTVLRYTWRQVRGEHAAVAADIAAHYEPANPPRRRRRPALQAAPRRASPSPGRWRRWPGGPGGSGPARVSISRISLRTA